MKAPFYLTLTELKIILKDKSFFIWALLLPLVFIFIFGSMGGGGGEREQINLVVVAPQTNAAVERFVEGLKAEGLKVKVEERTPSLKTNVLILPPDFGKAIKEGQQVNLELKLSGKQMDKTSVFLKLCIYRAAAKMIAEGLAGRIKPLIVHTSSWYRREKEIPQGFNFYVPAMVVMFILFNVLMYPGLALWRFRERKLVDRFAATPMGKGGLWLAFFLLGLFVGVLSTASLLISARLLFSVDFGPYPLAVVAIVILYTAAVANLAVLLGSLIKKREIIMGLSVLIANLFSALGGCWWPLELVPENLQKIASFLPTAWTISALTKLIFFRLPPSTVISSALLLIALFAATTFLSIKFFKLR